MAWIETAAGASSGYLSVVAVGTAAVVMAMIRQERRETAQRRRKQRLQEELEAYSKLDVSVERGERALAVRVCRTVTRVSRFPRAALLLESGLDKLQVSGSAGFDDVAVMALNAWAAAEAGEDGELRSGLLPSYVVTLRPPTDCGVMAVEDVRCRSVLMVPLESVDGRLVGALAVCVEDGGPREDESGVLEVLAAKLACALGGRRMVAQMPAAAEVDEVLRVVEEESWRERRGA